MAVRFVDMLALMTAVFVDGKKVVLDCAWA